jgi:P-type Ca2+ transporter type 2C
LYFLGQADEPDEATTRYARTAVFATAALFQLLLVLGLRHTQAPFWEHGLWRNYRLTLAVLAGFSLQLLIIYWPPLSALFHTTPLAFTDLDIVLMASVTGLVAVEIEKAFERRRLLTQRANEGD